MTEHSEELLACPNPWCEAHSRSPVRNRHGIWRVECECGVQSWAKPTKAEAITAWNTRSDTALTEALARVKEYKSLTGVMADAIHEADDIIAVNCGVDAPKSWDRTMRRVSAARALPLFGRRLMNRSRAMPSARAGRVSPRAATRLGHTATITIARAQ